MSSSWKAAAKQYVAELLHQQQQLGRHGSAAIREFGTLLDKYPIVSVRRTHNGAYIFRADFAHQTLSPNQRKKALKFIFGLLRDAPGDKIMFRGFLQRSGRVSPSNFILSVGRGAGTAWKAGIAADAIHITCMSVSDVYPASDDEIIRWNMIWPIKDNDHIMTSRQVLDAAKDFLRHGELFNTHSCARCSKPIS